MGLFTAYEVSYLVKTLAYERRRPSGSMPPKSHCQRITIKHPGYGRNNTLFALPACDGAGAEGKAHYATVHSACTIIANNRQDGWLSSSPSGEPRTHPDSAGLVPVSTTFISSPSSPHSP